ncbi:trypsin-like serine peptidase, partial [Saccharothrix carnea]
MLLWINGPFGGGKTQTAHELLRRLPGSFVSDPEHVGFALHRMTPRALRGDFQDLASWRQGVVEVLDRAASGHDGVIVVPMTVVEPAYFREVVGGLRDRGHDVRHFADEDYAVLVTEQRIGDAFGFLGTREYDSGWDDDHLWSTMGYATDVPQGAGQGLIPTFQQRVALDEDEFDLGSGRAMTTTADAMKRQSGSPMFGTWGDQTQVVAVISATGEVFLSGTENWCSGGTDLNRLVRKA